MSDRVLVNDWHVVAIADAVQPGQVLPVRLLGVDLVVWRGGETGVLAWSDRCPHRSIRLSSGRVEGNTLVCPYHGLAYNEQGRCVNVPAHPDYVPPPQACIPTYRVQERYGLIFVCLGEPEHDIPAFWEWDDPNHLKFLSGPHYCRCGGFRAIENFLDLAHLPFIHAGILGSPNKAVMPDYQVLVDENGIQMADIQIWQSDPVGVGHGTIAHYHYWVFRPLTAYLQKETPDGQRLTIWYAVTPVSEEEFIGWMWVAVNFGDASQIDEMRSFQDKIVRQDLMNLEQHNPKQLPLHPQAEFHLPCDRGSLAYRKWLKALGVTYGVIESEVRY
ncbi:aromatic ring-hydroxylating dioxygenase subunit alpha [Oscillatoria sp. FACHB-1407]|nr:aromatic ring-hydroxylating dioxygenase subunit alpha [Oscillatoria sp. FACHB-1407]